MDGVVGPVLGREGSFAGVTEPVLEGLLALLVTHVEVWM